MGNPRASSVAPLASGGSAGSIELGPEQSFEQGPEQARDFHFAVTWVTLFAYLDPVEAAGPRPRFQNPASTLALVPVVAAPLIEQRVERAGFENAGLENAAWEMVVPKMIRSDVGEFTPAEIVERQLL
jgi:hypothetical protein